MIPWPEWSSILLPSIYHCNPVVKRESMPYIPFESELYQKQWKKLCKKDKPLEERFKSVVAAIIANPQNFDSPLKADRAHSVKKKAIEERYRFIYRYCERCIQVNKKRCADCESAKCDVKTIVFEEVFHRDDGY
jgi:mRNA-degrading endonuclease YafQ of YafQ-DinJ toxin-antitoxin module